MMVRKKGINILARIADRVGITNLRTSTEKAGVKSKVLKTDKVYRYPANRGFRKDLGYEVKSTMEANCIRHFKSAKVNGVFYEKDIFYFKPNKWGIKAYVPDIKVEFGKRTYYYEVKGVMDRVSMYKKYLMQTQYPWIKLFFITAKEYRLIEKYYARKTPYWEF